MEFHLKGQPILNYEVDGPKHNNPTKKLFRKKYDEYLTSAHDVKIIRIDVSSNTSKQNNNIELFNCISMSNNKSWKRSLK